MNLIFLLNFSVLFFVLCLPNIMMFIILFVYYSIVFTFVFSIYSSYENDKSILIKNINENILNMFIVLLSYPMWQTGPKKTSFGFVAILKLRAMFLPQYVIFHSQRE